MAEGAAKAAAHLVEVNLKVTGTDPRLAEAQELVRAAAADTERARS